MMLRDFNTSKKVVIIAEIGVNHEGDFGIACDLIIKAKTAGVDGVKFQTYKAEEYVSTEDKERFTRAKRFQLTYSQFKKLSVLAHKHGLLFISTPLDFKSVDALEPLVDAYKVASCDFTNLTFIHHIISKRKPFIISSGMASIDEIDCTMNYIKSMVSKDFYYNKISLLHCVASYPAPIEEVNLRTIPYLKERYGITVGYSDHTKGILASQIAVGAGAEVIEKHFTYRKENQSFRDHALSADLNDMRELVKQIRTIESIMGLYGKYVARSERENVKAMRRGLGVRRDIKKGKVIRKSDLTFLRPSTGLPASAFEAAIGKMAARNIRKGEVIGKRDVSCK